MPQTYYVYLLASTYKRLYTGVTSNLEICVEEHKRKINPASFTAQYNIDRLVHFERYSEIQQALAREKEIKKWNRLKKIALIVTSNPTWKDLSLDFGKQISPLAETTHRPLSQPPRSSVSS